MKRLNQRGIAHHFLLAFAVIGIVGAFAFQQVAGSAQIAPEAGVNTSTKVSTSGCTTRPTLSVGSTGVCVKLVQAKVGATADGNFGPATKAKVIAFQKSHGLTADGIVGTATWAKLLGSSTTSSATSTVKANTTAKPSPLVYCTYTIGASKERTVTDAHISAAACKQHNGKASSKPIPAPTTYKPANLVGYKTGLLTLTTPTICGIGSDCAKSHSSAKYKLCATAYQINNRNVKSTVNFGKTRFALDASPDVTFGSKKITTNNTTSCRTFDVNLYSFVFDTFTTKITAGSNSQITAASLTNTKSGESWNLTLTDAVQ